MVNITCKSTGRRCKTDVFELSWCTSNCKIKRFFQYGIFVSYLTYQNEPVVGKALILPVHWCVDTSKLALVLRTGQPILNQADILNNASSFLAHLAYLLLVMERSFLVSFGILYHTSSFCNTTVKPLSVCSLWQVSVALTICNCSNIYLVFVFWFSFPFLSETVGKRLLKYKYFSVRKIPNAMDIVKTRESKFCLKSNREKNTPTQLKPKKQHSLAE